MTQIIHDVYQMNLASSGKLKLRAKALLADGLADSTFGACVALHEAARIQRLAVESLPTCPPVTLLSSLVEECWCYVEGRDPPRAAEVWGDVLRAREGVSSESARSLLSRLAPRFESTQRAFARTVGSSTAILVVRDARRLDGLALSLLKKARSELDHVLADFPGIAEFWWMRYRLSESLNDKPGAWDALERARRLAPTNQRFLAMSLLVASWALVAARADELLQGVRSTLDRATAQVNLMYALAEVSLARNSTSPKRQIRWRRALESVESGLARADSDSVRRNLKATQLLLRELLANREPTMDILYLAGLGGDVALVRGNADVMDVLTTGSRRIELASAA